MESVLVERAAGLDVHKDSVVVCLLLQNGSKVDKLKRSFGTFTRDLHQLAAFLLEQGVTHVGMESTGPYWLPVYAVLEAQPALRLIVGNAQHIKNVPGRKTDCNDAQWLATLVRLGLIRPSLVPPPDLRALRDLVRAQRTFIQQSATERNRVLKLLEMTGIKLDSVASDVFGVSGLLMLRALAQGVTDVQSLAQLARGTLRKKLPQLTLALDGRFLEHHRLLLGCHLSTLDHFEAQIATLQAQIDRLLLPYKSQWELLQTIPGVGSRTATTIISELGVRMECFPSAGHAAAWAGVSPANKHSAGKNLGARSRKGNPHLKAALVEAAWSARNKKGSYLRDKFRRLKGRRDKKRAAVAIAHKLLLGAYHVLKHGTPYQDLGEHYLDQLDQRRTAQHLVRRLQRLGYQVSVSKDPAATPRAVETLS